MLKATASAKFRPLDVQGDGGAPSWCKCGCVATDTQSNSSGLRFPCNNWFEVDIPPMVQPHLATLAMGMHSLLPIDVNAADVDRRQVFFFSAAPRTTACCSGNDLWWWLGLQSPLMRDANPPAPCERQSEVASPESDWMGIASFQTKLRMP